MVFDGAPLAGDELPDARSLTLIEARLLDEAIGEVDWTAIPRGVRRTTFRVPSGELAGIGSSGADLPRIVLVPGITGSKEDFALMTPLFLRAGYRVDAFDLAGHYESRGAGPERLEPPRTRYDLELFVDDLIAVLEAGPTPANLLGYSFAGTVASVAASRRPELVASLTLLSTPPLSGQVFRGLVSGYGLGAGLSRVASARAHSAIFLWGLQWNLGRLPRHRLDFVRDRVRSTRRASVDDIFALMRRTPDLDAAVSALSIPKLVAFGRRDTWSPARHRAFASRIGAEAVEYETGHSPCETMPHQLVRDILRVIERR